MLSEMYECSEDNENYFVLILVLMDHALGDCSLAAFVNTSFVLILVLMDHALGDYFLAVCANMFSCLNPCFNGPCSRSANSKNVLTVLPCLNPCFNGPCSRRVVKSLDESDSVES